jgi:CBS domain-containing protein
MGTGSEIGGSLIAEIERANDPAEIPNTSFALPTLVQKRLHYGQDIEKINKFINVVAEAVVHKCLSLSIEEMETPPPVGFVFLVLGSACRKEQTIKTDQDNAILFEDIPTDREKEVNEYFLRVGEKVCDWLHEAGYEYCEGDIMAKNPTWCRPLSAFKGYFSKWIDQVEPKAQLRFGSFFDFRAIAGDMRLEAELRQHVVSELENSRGFFRFLAEIAANYKAPLTKIGNLAVEKDGDYKGMFDFKGAMEPYIFIARLMSYKYAIEAMDTVERFNELAYGKRISHQDHLRIVGAYRLLMRMRLVNQLDAALAEKKGHGPLNHVKVSELSAEDQGALKRALRTLKPLQRYLDNVKADDSWSQGPQEITFEE